MNNPNYLAGIGALFNSQRSAAKNYFGKPTNKLNNVLDDIQDNLLGLLNTRNHYEDKDSLAPVCENSLPKYGIPNLSSFDASSKTAKNKLMIILKKVITNFEPRLEQTEISLLNSDKNGLDINFQVKALLQLEKDVFEVKFDLIMDNLSKRFKIPNIGTL